MNQFLFALSLRAFTIFRAFLHLVFPEQQKATLHIPILPFWNSNFKAEMWSFFLLSASKQRVWTPISIVPEVNSEQCCYLSGVIGSSGWKAGSWLLFHPTPHHNTPVTHPIACLGHSWGCIVRRIEHKRVVNIHFMSMKATWLHLLLLKFSLSMTSHTLSSSQTLLHSWVTVGHMSLMYARHIRL